MKLTPLIAYSRYCWVYIIVVFSYVNSSTHVKLFYFYILSSELKKASKRMSCSKRYKIQKKVRVWLCHQKSLQLYEACVNEVATASLNF